MGAYVTMEVLSQRYGWTPSQIRDMHADDVEVYLHIIKARADLERAKQMKYG